ncbi:MAG: phosphomannomutase/phosphoglucomutase [Candidatus Aenigmarchaeota archaeon]|nr:phosphomannomutase/phosphoglucomutase [Candidatus Aenigmarchaeota archaeon]
MPSPNIFRAYDIRGVYPEEIDEESAYRIALAYSKIFHDAKEIAVGHDGRKSSIRLYENISKGLSDSGINVMNIGLVPTPLMYFSVCHYGLSGGIEVTGSHNPKEWTGLKLQGKDAVPITWEKGIGRIKEFVLSGKIGKSDKKEKGKIKSHDPVPDYIRHLSGRAKLKRKLKIILDSGNGSCGLIPERIFKKLGCDVKTIFGNVDTDYPNHAPDPHQKDTLSHLRQTVIKEKADVGFAFDGDGDRVGMVDEKGEIVETDSILIMLARKALAMKKGDVVVEVRSSMALLEDIKRHGGRPIMGRAGHAYVLEEVMKRKAVFGGEVTGHLYFPLEYYPYDDGIFVALKLAEIVSEYGKISGYISALPEAFASEEVFIESSDEEKFQIIKRIVKYLKKENYKVLDIDGARIDFGNGWGLIRASNTTPHIKVRWEGKTEKDRKEIGKRLKGILEGYRLELR